MKIGIDLLPLQSDPKRRGISNFVYNLINELLQIDDENDYFFFNAKNVKLDFLKETNSKVHVIKNAISVKASSNLDIFIFTSFFDFEKNLINPDTLKCKTVVIVYDIIPLILWDNYIEFFSENIKIEYFKRIEMVRNCSKIFTISQSVKNDLIEILEMHEDSIDVIYAGFNENNEMPEDEDNIFSSLKQKHHIAKNYIFSVPSMDYRKNIFGLIEAYGLLSSEIKDAYQLVISNELTPEYEKKLRDHAAKNNVSNQELIFTNYVSEDELKVLYNNSSLFVFPSFNEGFGLPVLEAMSYGIPVITSNNSSLPEVAGDAGILVNPYCSEDIMKAMNKVLVNETLRRDLSLKSQTQSKKFSWRKTAQLVLMYSEKFHFSNPILNLGLITTWNTKCGIAEYSKYLIDGLSEFNVSIFCNNDSDVIEHDGLNIIRCWGINSDDYNKLFNNIVKKKIDIVHFQFNFGLFNIFSLINLKKRLKNIGIKVIITFHATQDVKIGLNHIRLRDYSKDLQSFDKIIVHTTNDLNRLRDLGVKHNVALIPQGIKLFENRSIEEARKEVGIPKCHIISTFGFLLPHKGILEIIDAVALLKQEYNDIIFFVVSALYPADTSVNYFEKCKQKVQNLGLENNVVFFPNFMSENEINDLLQASDIIALCYQNTQESSSAAVKYAIANKRPIMVTDVSIFDEYSKEVYKIPKCSPENIATGVSNLLQDEELKKKLIVEVENKIMLENWVSVSKRYSELILNL